MITKIKKITKLENYNSNRYDIEVEDNHNFFANGILVHNCQNLPEYFEKYKDVEFEISEKLDGSSMTVFWDGEKFGVCSRNLELKEDEVNTFWKVANRLDLRNKMTNGRKIAIQGELVGESIQKNPLKIQGQDFYVFDIWDIEEHRYLTSEERFKITSELGLKNVPIIGVERVLSLYDSMDKILNYADSNSKFGDFLREGVVFKSTELINGSTVSFKAINNNYLLKHE